MYIFECRLADLDENTFNKELKSKNWNGRLFRYSNYNEGAKITEFDNGIDSNLIKSYESLEPYITYDKFTFHNLYLSAVINGYTEESCNKINSDKSLSNFKFDYRKYYDSNFVSSNFYPFWENKSVDIEIDYYGEKIHYHEKFINRHEFDSFINRLNTVYSSTYKPVKIFVKESLDKCKRNKKLSKYSNNELIYMIEKDPDKYKLYSYDKNSRLDIENTYTALKRVREIPKKIKQNHINYKSNLTLGYLTGMTAFLWVPFVAGFIWALFNYGIDLAIGEGIAAIILSGFIMPVTCPASIIWGALLKPMLIKSMHFSEPSLRKDLYIRGIPENYEHLADDRLLADIHALDDDIERNAKAAITATALTKLLTK